MLKTLAVDEEFRGAGLGAILVDEIHARAAERGASVLHALMQVTNASRMRLEMVSVPRCDQSSCSSFIRWQSSLTVTNRMKSGG